MKLPPPCFTFDKPWCPPCQRSVALALEGWAELLLTVKLWMTWHDIRLDYHYHLSWMNENQSQSERCSRLGEVWHIRCVGVTLFCHVYCEYIGYIHAVWWSGRSLLTSDSICITDIVALTPAKTKEWTGFNSSGQVYEKTQTYFAFLYL